MKIPINTSVGPIFQLLELADRKDWTIEELDNMPNTNRVTWLAYYKTQDMLNAHIKAAEAKAIKDGS